MPIYRVTPLAPAYLLSVGAVLILILGAAVAPDRRHWLTIVLSALATFSLVFVGSGYPANVQMVRVMVEWLGDPAIALRVPSFEPFLWMLMLSLLAISLAERGLADRLSPVHQALLFSMTAMACGVVLAGTYRTLAFALLLFDGTAALFALTDRRPGQATGRLLLGVLSSTLVILATQGQDYLTAHPHSLGGLFSLTVWLRLGLYPLIESGPSSDSLPPMRMGGIVVNLAVGLYLVSARVDPWLAWLAGVTTALHGALAWLEPGQERALAHTGHALAGGILTIVATVGSRTGAEAASISMLAALVTLGLTSPRLGRPTWSRLQGLWAYLPPLLATASLFGVPFTLGWGGRGALYQATWEAGVPVTLAVVVVAEGAALSTLFRYWRRLLRNSPEEALHLPTPDRVGSQSPQGAQKQDKSERDEGAVWHSLGATLASIPILIPIVAPRALMMITPSATPTAVPPLPSLSASLGLAGSLLWAFFLGYGRRRLLSGISFSLNVLMTTLRLAWLLRVLGHTLDMLGRVLLRTRAVIEGEHYLAWAILLALGLTLVMLLR